MMKLVVILLSPVAQRKRPEKGLNVQEYNEREKGETRVSGSKNIKNFLSILCSRKNQKHTV